MNDLIPLAGKYVLTIYEDNEKIREFIQKQWIPMEVFRLVYGTLAGRREITPLEDLPDDEKKRLKGIMKVWGTGDMQNRMKQTKAIYVIEQMTQKKIEL